jgi:hypothetical protein
MEVPVTHNLNTVLKSNNSCSLANVRLSKCKTVPLHIIKAEVMKVNLDRKCFTKHGQNMKAVGRELMAKRIVEAIKHTLKVCKKIPFIMKWKEDPSKDNQGPGEVKNGVGEGRDPTENQNDSVKTEDNNSTQQEKETVVMASRRS